MPEVFYLRGSQKLNARSLKSRVTKSDREQTIDKNRQWVSSVFQQFGRIQVTIASDPSHRDVGTIGQQAKIRDKPKCVLFCEPRDPNWNEYAEDRSAP